MFDRACQLLPPAYSPYMRVSCVEHPCTDDIAVLHQTSEERSAKEPCQVLEGIEAQGADDPLAMLTPNSIDPSCRILERAVVSVEVLHQGRR